jgi:hypothetical protein
MFYSSFKFNRQTQFLTPKGPSFKWAPTYTFNIDGTTISLKVPRHRHNGPTNPKTARRNIHIGPYSFDTFMLDTPGWQSSSILYRWWDFYGPNFTGEIGGSQMQAYLLRPSKLKEDVSFFHPRAFEGLIADLIPFYFQNNGHVWLAPMNWKPLRDKNNLCVQFDCTNANELGDRFKRFFMMPMAKDYVFCMNISMDRNPNFEKTIPRDQWVDRTPFIELMDQVINSVQVKLSPQALAQQQEALKDLPLEQRELVKDFAPLKWD